MEKIVGEKHNNDILKIAVVGPESTGKTMLSKMLAKHFNALYVPEYARSYLEKTNGIYQETDLLTIARAQLNLEKQYSDKNTKILFCDTNLLVIKIWWEHKFKTCDPWVMTQLNKCHYDLSILCDVDIPWQPDPLREHPHLRQYFFELYKDELSKLNHHHIVVSGTEEERLEAAIKAIRDL